MNEIDPREVMAALDSAPRDLSDAYEAVFARIERRSKCAKSLALRTLSWVFYAKRSLHMDELREALAVRDSDIQLHETYLLDPGSIVEVCESLIVHDDSSGIVRFTHYTVQEFLQSNNVIPLLSMVDLAKTCLNVRHIRRALHYSHSKCSCKNISSAIMQVDFGVTTFEVPVKIAQKP